MKRVDLFRCHVLKKRTRLIKIECILYLKLPLLSTKGHLRYIIKEEVKINLMEL